MNVLTTPRILFVTNTAFTLFSLRLNLMMWAKNHGLQVSCASAPGHHSTELTKRGLDFHSLPMSQHGVSVSEELRLLIAIIALIRKLNPTICHFFSVKAIIWGVLASRILGCRPAVCTFTGLGVLKQYERILVKLLWFLLRISDHQKIQYVFQNASDMEFFEKLVPRSNCTRVIAGSGVDTNAYRFPARNAKDKKNVMMFSRLLESKGTLVYIDAVAKLKEEFPEISSLANFRLVGGCYPGNPNGVDAEWVVGEDFVPPEVVQKRVVSAGVEWFEHLQDTKPLLHWSDIVVLPSWYAEGLPRSLLEALACGNLIVTTDQPGCRDVVVDGNGLLVQPKSVSDLASGLKQVIDMSESETVEGQKVSRDLVVKRYSDEVIIGEYVELYNVFCAQSFTQ